MQKGIVVIITIDGPTASGKSSVARLIAENLGFCHFSTGLLYRAVAFVLVRGCGDIKAQGYEKNLENADFSFISRISAGTQGKATLVFFDQKDITPQLDDALSQMASAVSAQKTVRDQLLEVQRCAGKNNSLVVDGRDCGSVIFPEADFKFFLTAHDRVRAQRVFTDLKRVGVYQNVEHALQELTERDERDRSRTVAPLVIPKDAVVIDNSDLTLEQTVEKMIRLISA